MIYRAVKKAPCIATACSRVATHNRCSCDGACHFKFFEVKAFCEANAHVINLHQLTKLFGFHTITPALCVMLKFAYSLWLNLAEIKRDGENTTADDLLIVTPLNSSFITLYAPSLIIEVPFCWVNNYPDRGGY